MNNIWFLQKIELLLQYEHISLKLIKVKGHSGDFWNDEVDELAKEGLSNLHVFRNDFTYGNSHIQWMPHYDHIPIEQNARKFLKEIMNSYNCKAWTDLKINNGKFDPNFKLYEWTITYNVINQVKHFKCNSTFKNSFWSFTIKMLYGLLPLGPILKQRRSLWYKNFYCTFCSTNEEETLEHIQ